MISETQLHSSTWQKEPLADEDTRRDEPLTGSKVLFYIGLMILWVLCLMIGEGRADVVVSESEVHAAVTEYVQDRLTDVSSDIEVTVRRRGELLIDGVGAVRLRVRQDRFRSQARSIPLVLEVMRGPALVREYRLVADVRYFDDVVVAARSIVRGERVGEEAVMIERRDVTMILGKYYSSIDELEGLQAKMRIGFGRPLSMHYLEKRPLVERGDMVRIEAKVGGIVAVTMGLAKDKGAKGDHVIVVNTSSREKLLAEVIGPGKVRVLF
ncbi:MAG: flagellar basal body P-ring formation protein FlgA [Candidatus Latescibacteria bacterium]|jgi:flagella basal body P-ring formation protein FlgA|nr:flagellar basal body P-ring formation protein FlgA [Candidatus Latescibacterota bacterium]MBT5829817.1 flagellar basal body P-ring formation protein FlgA [Candidatus Latescibacterota bacterium]